MSGPLLLIATGALAALGFALMAMSQIQHRRLVRAADGAGAPTVFRFAGIVLVALAAVPAVLRDGAAFGLVVWATVLTVSAMAVIAWLSVLRARSDRRRRAGDAAP